MDASDLADLIRLAGIPVADFVALVAEALAHLDKELTRVDELDLATARLLFPVGQKPQISGNACVVEELVRERDDRFEPIVLDDPSPDVAHAAAGVPGEQRRAVEYDADPAAALVRRAHLRQHVLQEQKRA